MCIVSAVCTCTSLRNGLSLQPAQLNTQSTGSNGHSLI
uniref:Uncharacterized protein n=1 Tax=Amphimedon queenslandica TaxID=400682 RepID=A0A1X7TAC9_AMPQE